MTVCFLRPENQSVTGKLKKEKGENFFSQLFIKSIKNNISTKLKCVCVCVCVFVNINEEDQIR